MCRILDVAAIQDIHKCLMNEINIKECLDSLRKGLLDY